MSSADFRKNIREFYLEERIIRNSKDITPSLNPSTFQVYDKVSRGWGWWWPLTGEWKSSTNNNISSEKSDKTTLKTGKRKYLYFFEQLTSPTSDYQNRSFSRLPKLNPIYSQVAARTRNIANIFCPLGELIHLLSIFSIFPLLSNIVGSSAVDHLTAATFPTLSICAVPHFRVSLCDF